MSQPDLLRFEEQAWGSGFLHLAGVDEAGRGPLAGPVVAAAISFSPEHIRACAGTTYDALNDSKKLSAIRREHYYEILQADEAVEIGVGIVEAEEIDRINILRATHHAMAEALKVIQPQFALIDGLPVDGLPYPSQSIVKGDSKSLSIAAASVIAKVTRDRLMSEYDTLYPCYGFADHNGYGTPAHLTALKEHGPSPIHRRSFRPVAELDQLDFL